MKLGLLSRIAAVGCALLWAAMAGAGTPVRVFTTAYPPYVAPDLPQQGVAVRLLRELLEPRGYTPVIEFQPWARLGTELQAGRVDLVLLAWPGDIRRHGLIEGMPWFGSRVGLFVRRPDRRPAGLPLNEARGLNIGVVRGYDYPPALHAHGLTLQPANTDLQNLRKLASGRIDAVVLERAVGQHLLARARDGVTAQTITWQEPAFAVEPMYLSIAPGRPLSDALQRTLAEAFRAYKADGRHARLLQAHDLDPPP